MLFDQTHFKVVIIKTPLAAQALQRLGYADFYNELKDRNFIPDTTIKIKINNSKFNHTITIRIIIRITISWVRPLLLWIKWHPFPKQNWNTQHRYKCITTKRDIQLHFAMQ